MWTGIAGLVGAALILGWSPFRHAEVPTATTDTDHSADNDHR
ncbi:hypothetical protein [Saccharothrix texasensis]|nr:hypothetical protein [Saccharothrix texasensis]